jgi:hypothetical protein
MRYIPQELAGIYHKCELMSRAFPASLTILCLIRMIGHVGYSAPCINCEDGMAEMDIANTSSIRPTFNIIKREPIFVNPFIALTSQFLPSRCSSWRFTICWYAGTLGRNGVLYLPIYHFPSQNRRLHPILRHLLLWHIQNIFA